MGFSVEAGTIDNAPLSLDELDEALQHIQLGMPRYKGKQLTAQTAVDLVVHLRESEGVELVEQMLTLGVTEQGYDQLCALRQDLKHHTSIDIDATPAKEKRMKGERNGKQKKLVKKEVKKQKKSSKRSDVPAGGGLEISAEEVIGRIFHQTNDPREKLMDLLMDTPLEAIDHMPAITRALEEAAAAQFAEIERTFNVKKELLLRWRKFKDATAQHRKPEEASELHRLTPPETVAGIDGALALLAGFYQTQYQRLLSEYGLEKSIIIRWSTLLKQHPNVLETDMSKARDDTRIAQGEMNALVHRDPHLTPLTRPEPHVSRYKKGASRARSPSY